MIERTISRRILSLSDDFKVLLVTGARQVGKTTLLKMLCENGRTYITLDDKSSLDLAKTDPEAFFLLNPVPCMIDEVQRAPELMIKIKEIVDSDNRKNKIWLTESQKPRLIRHISETLAGRVVEIDVFPLSQAEKQGDPYRPSFYPSFDGREAALWDYKETIENVVLGGYPELQYIKKENRADWFHSYISTYLLGDILYEEGDIGIGITEFRHFLMILAARTAEPVNYSAIAAESGLTAYKAKILVSLLVSYGIIYLLPAYAGNTLKSLTKTPRMHFTDTGLCCSLLGIEDVDGLIKHPLAGRIFESYVVGEVVRNAINNADFASFYYYREESKGKGSGQAEIDLLKEKNGIIYPIEIKMNASPVSRMAKWFSSIPEDRRGMGTIICMNKEKTLLGKDLLVLPASMI